MARGEERHPRCGAARNRFPRSLMPRPLWRRGAHPPGQRLGTFTGAWAGSGVSCWSRGSGTRFPSPASRISDQRDRPLRRELERPHEQGTPLSLRYDTQRRPADAGHRLLASRTRSLSREMLDDLGIDYVEGGYPGANPTDTAFFAKKRTRRAAFTAFGMVKRAGRSVSNDPGLQDLLQREGGRHLLRRQGVGFSRQARARLQQRGEPRIRSPSRSRRQSRRGARRCSTASTSSTATRPIRTMRSPASRRRLAQARAGRCSATPMAARYPTRWRRSLATVVARFRRRADRHPRAQRHRPGRGEFASPRCAPARGRSRAR